MRCGIVYWGCLSNARRLAVPLCPFPRMELRMRSCVSLEKDEFRDFFPRAFQSSMFKILPWDLAKNWGPFSCLPL